MNREPDTLYLDDLVDRIPNLKTKKVQLFASNGITTIQDLIGTNKDDIKRFVKCTPGLAVVRLTGIKNAPGNTICNDTPKGMYWLDKANPYAARHGIEKDKWGVKTWVTKLKSMDAFAGVLSIKYMTQHIVKQTKKSKKEPSMNLHFIFIMML